MERLLKAGQSLAMATRRAKKFEFPAKLPSTPCLLLWRRNLGAVLTLSSALPEWAKRKILTRLDDSSQRLAQVNELLNGVKCPSIGSKEYIDALKEAGTLERLEELRSSLDDLQANVNEARSIIEDRESNGELVEFAREELKTLQLAIDEKEELALRRLVAKDDVSKSNAYIEVRQGVGGEEAALFAEELFEMYRKFVFSKPGWSWESVSSNLALVKSNSGSAFEDDDISSSVYGLLQFEAGVHRVQRVPSSERSGRVHTSTAVVYVFPEMQENDSMQLDPDELKIDVFRASGAGGQHVNTTESAVRITHIPTGLVVSIQDERSQRQNKQKAIKVLTSRVMERIKKERSSETRKLKSVSGIGDRSEKVRTYNYSRDTVLDHRLNASVSGISDFLAGSERLETDFLLPLYYMDVVDSISDTVKQEPLVS